MKVPRDHRDYLEDIRHAVLKALEFVEGMAYEDFLVDDKTLFAVVRALEILGEATKRIPNEVRDRAPQIPWRSMAGIRDKLIHDYVNVNVEVVWKTVTEDLPSLLPMIQGILDQMSEGDAGSSHASGRN